MPVFRLLPKIEKLRFQSSSSKRWPVAVSTHACPRKIGVQGREACPTTEGDRDAYVFWSSLMLRIEEAVGPRYRMC